ncbi:MAG TPA: YfhO family protein [Bacteroidota bacterium]|jgi:hypothetical protein|nr:YfhO family protein [Bacteroidota bacterium]
MTKGKPLTAPPKASRTLAGIKDWHVVSAIVLLTVIFFRNIIFKSAFFWEDFMYFYYPARNFAAVSMAGGELPLWNPFTLNGMPFQADIQTALFYIPNMLLTLFVSGGKLSFYWLELEIVGHYVIAGVGMYYLAKSYGLERIYAFFAALVFMFSGYAITRAIHQPMICETAWLPLIILLFRKMMKEKSAVAMILCAVVLGHAILAGFPQLTLYIYFLLFLTFAVECIARLRSGGVKTAFPVAALAGGVVVISLALAAIQLLPTIELAPYTQRAEMTYEKSLDGSLSWPGLITLIVPKFFGAYGAQGSDYWMQGSYGQYWETVVYIGIPALVCVVFASLLMRKNADVMFLFCVVVFSLLYALGDSFFLHKLFFTHVPAFNKFREPGRLSFLWTFAAAILAGFGLRQCVEESRIAKKSLQKILFGVALAGVALYLAVQQGWLQEVRGADSAQVHQIASSATTTAMIFILGVCAILFLRSRNALSGTAAIALLFGVQFIDMHVFGFDQNNGTTNPDDYFDRTASIVTMVKEQGRDEYFRVNSRAGNAMLLDRNQGMIDRIFTMEGYSSLVLQRVYPPAKDRDHVNNLMNAKYYVDVDAQRRTMSLGRSTTYVPRAYMVYHTDVIRDDAEQKAFMSGDVFNPRSTVVLDDQPEVPLTAPDTTTPPPVRISSYGLNTIELDVTTPKKGYLSLSEIYYPAWKAYVDNVEHPVYRANWNLRAVFVDAGTHHVSLRYESGSFHRGIWITLGAFLLCIIGLVVLGRKKQPKEPAKGVA